MANKMKNISFFSSFITVVCTVLYMKYKNELALTLAITFGTTAYHFLMRLGVGGVINLLLNNQVDYRANWFQVSDTEQKLYTKLRVKKWKNRMPSYAPKNFDSKIHSWDEIAQAMCQAEVVHEIIIILSFIPIFASIYFGAISVFVITSILAACVDATFVVMQRYNRPRIVKLIENGEVNKNIRMNIIEEPFPKRE